MQLFHQVLDRVCAADHEHTLKAMAGEPALVEPGTEPLPPEEAEQEDRRESEHNVAPGELALGDEGCRRRQREKHQGGVCEAAVLVRSCSEKRLS